MVDRRSASEAGSSPRPVWHTRLLRRLFGKRDRVVHGRVHQLDENGHQASAESWEELADPHPWTNDLLERLHF